MSIVFSKNKAKRSRSSISESSNSFVKNVTSRVSGLLPATLTKWFSSPSSSSANGSVPAADATDSSTEDEASESPIVIQPPSKRMRFTTSGSKYNQYTPPVTSPSHAETSKVQQSSNLYNTVQSPPGRNTFVREPNYVSTPYISPADVSRIDAHDVTDRTDRDITYKSPHIVSSTGQSVLLKRKSIFDTSVYKEDTSNPCTQPSTSTSKDAKLPYYKPAYFGSPFYQGRTMYGGASSSTYINQPNIQRRKVACVQPSTKDSTNVNMSYSARKVLDLLEDYCSPLKEAKRIPVIRKQSSSVNNSTTMDTSLPTTSHGYSYKRQELHVPSMCSILQIKRQSRLMETTKVARQIIASHSSTLSGFQHDANAPETDINNEADREFSSKMKSRLTRRNRGEDPFEMPEPVQLPTAVLQIDKDNLPKFSMSSTPSVFASTPLHSSYTPSFQPLFASAAPTHTTAVSHKNSTARADTSTTESSPRGNAFKFASPVAISADSTLNVTTPPKFTFGPPDRTVDAPKRPEEKNSQQELFNRNKTKTSLVAPSSSKPSDSDWNCPDCLVKNKNIEKCVCCGAKRPSAGNSNTSIPKSSKCTVCKFAVSLPDADKCINCEKASTQGDNSIPLPIPQPADPSKWKCEGCWVSNEEKADKCVCCGTRNLKVTNATPSVKPAAVEKDWKCEDCWIANKSSVEKCAACGGAKPGGKHLAAAAPLPRLVTYSPFAAPLDDKLVEIAKAQKAKWECSGCLVRNDPDKQKCICCGMEREGVSKEITSKPFTFPKDSNVTFKFGIDPKEQETIMSKKTEEGAFKLEPTRKLEETETNNNKLPTFTSTVPSNKSDAAKVATVAKVAFTFGIPKDATVDAAPAVLTIRAASPKTPVEEKAQEVPKVNFNATSQESSTSIGSGFVALPPSSVKAPPKDLPSFLPNSTPLLSSEAKDPSPFCTEDPIAKKQKAQTFSFGVSTEKSATSGLSMFGAPSSTASTSGFSFGVQSTPATTVASTASFDNPGSSVSGTAINMFGSNQPSVTYTPAPALTPVSAPAPAPAPAAAPAPAPAHAPAPAPAPEPPSTAASLFSFGSNGQSAAPGPDKRKFNFSFGTANNTSASSYSSGFKSTFGSTDTNSSSNAFAMPAPAPLLANNSNNGMTTSMGGDVGATTMQGFSAPAQETVWNGSSANVFGSNTSVQKPAPFSFGSPIPFNGAAGASLGQSAPSLFGSQQAAQSPFGMASTAASGQTGLFGTPTQASQPASFFTSAQPSGGMFGAPNAAPTFGTSAGAVPTFEAPSMAQAQAQAQAPQPAFTFGAPQSSGVFGFGAQSLQQTQSPQQPGGLYKFGSAGSPALMGGVGAGMGVQFNMGSAGAGAAPGAATIRRVRKAVRRNSQR